MSLFNKKRLPIETFKMTDEIIEKLRSGWYSDEYFNNTVKVLNVLSKEEYTFPNKENDLTNIVSVEKVKNGDIVVEMQFFTRRSPFSVVAGVDEALAILSVATGYYGEDGQFINTFNTLEIEAIEDGDIVAYDGKSSNVKPVLKVRGKYKDFGHLETALLGVLSIPTRVATNVYNVLVASAGKQVLFFPARFNHYKMQGIDGYAYWIATQRYQLDYGIDSKASVSTSEQGEWWGGKAGGTISHSTIACFLGNTSETMLQFSRIMDVEVPRIALVDFHNDCVGETIKVISSMWEEYWKHTQEGNLEEAKKYKLFGVRPDTSGNMIDESIIPMFNKEFDNGVTPRLIHNIREGIDSHWKELVTSQQEHITDLKYEEAKKFCNDIKIAVTGGFNAKRIEEFEEMNVPVDIYGVGSSLLENASCNGTKNDYTADIVKVEVEDRFYELSKVGRGVCYNEDLKKIDTSL